ncbi:MAG: carbon storage regulator [bacterium]
MLILGRKEGEDIVIDNKIIIKVVKIEGDQVKIGFEAPSDIEIYRKELLNDK